MATLAELNTRHQLLRRRLEEATAHIQLCQKQFEKTVWLIYSNPDKAATHIENQIKNGGADKAIEILEQRTNSPVYGPRRRKSPDPARSPENYRLDKRAAKLALPKIIRARERWLNQQFFLHRKLATVERKIRKAEKVLERGSLADRVIKTIVHGKDKRRPEAPVDTPTSGDDTAERSRGRDRREVDPEPGRLPTVSVRGRTYVIDEARGELRNVNDPTDKLDIAVWRKLRTLQEKRERERQERDHDRSR